jgi:hypothetical protein
VLSGWPASSAAGVVDCAISFAETVNALNPVSNSRAAGKSFWKRWKGCRVRWKGVVFDVKMGKKRQTIYIANDAGPTYHGYNVQLSISNYNFVAVLKKGQTILFNGVLDDYTAKKGRPVVIALESGELEGVYAFPAPPPHVASRQAASADPGHRSFAQFVDFIDCSVHTELVIRRHWHLLKNDRVDWSGKVWTVKISRKEAVIYLANSQKPPHPGYNIILWTRDVEKATRLKKGDSVSFSGKPERYHCRPNTHTVVTLVNGVLLGE